jgi:hypothetical protein
MRTLFIFALVTLSLRASAQQSMLDPAISNQTLGVETTELFPNGDIFTAGFVGDNAHVSRTTLAGSLVWSRICDSNSVFYGSAMTSVGDMVTVGNQFSSGLVSKFDPGGNTVWSKVFTPLGIPGDTVVTFWAVATDATGEIYVVGDKYKSPVRREVFMKLDASGNVSCIRELQSTNNKLRAKKIFVRNNSLFIFGDGVQFGKGVSVAKYSLAGTLLGYTVFGGFGPNDNLLDVVQTANGFVFSYWNANDPGVIRLARADENLAIVGSPVSLQPNGSDFGSLYLGALGLSQDGGIYVSGAMAGNSANFSFVLKVSGDLLVPIWGRKIPLDVPTYDLVKALVRETVGGNIIFSATRNWTSLGSNTGAIITALSGAGNAIGLYYCDLPQILSFDLVLDWLPTNPQTRTPQGLILTPSATTFSSYTPRVTVCNAMLPVEMLSFDGEQIDRKVELRWSTGSEHNSSHFEILRSTDEGQTWTEIGYLESVGNSSVVTNYVSADEHPEPGMNYYRLRQVDHNGTTTDEPKVVPVKFAVQGELLLYPNPLPKGVPLQGLEGQEFEVVTLSGQLVRGPATDTDLSHLPAGMYVIRVTKTGATSQVIVSD